jgi:predicted nucleic acid-binding protein
MPEITIVNTSPLFYLHRLGLLELLKKLYGHITVPEAVKRVSANRNRRRPASSQTKRPRVCIETRH